MVDGHRSFDTNSLAAFRIFSPILFVLSAVIRATLVALGIRKRKKVEGKVVLITGSACGLGRELALRFAKKGARLVLWDIDKEGNEDTAEICRQFQSENCTHPLHDGIRRHHNALSKCRVAQAPKRTRCYQPHSHTLSLLQCHTYTIDVSRREVVYKTADEVRSEVGDVDILINNAGILNDGKFMDVSDERIRKVMEVNVMANIWITRSFLPSMLSKNCGHVVAICSVAGLFGASGLVDYSVSKFAIVG
uniref:Estradiol 17-beta-dehydrogenase 8-like n=1 Tax=Ascaris lumbricoides TaxID=6252 RepID=A0A0M3HY18_ASCLU